MDSNQAKTGGAIVTLGNASLNVIDSHFISNMALSGGALSLQGSTTSIKNVTFRNNTARSMSLLNAVDGGAIFNLRKTKVKKCC